MALYKFRIIIIIIISGKSYWQPEQEHTVGLACGGILHIQKWLIEKTELALYIRHIPQIWSDM